MANRDGEARTEEDDEREGNKPGNHENVGAHSWPARRLCRGGGGVRVRRR